MPSKLEQLKKEIQRLRPEIEIAKINDNYFIDSVGNVYSRPTTRTNGGIIKQRINPYGYKTLKIIVDGKKVTRFVHRLIAEAFIKNKDKTKEYINHKDGNKLNNSLDNLEWVTMSENNKHAWDAKLQKRLSKSGEKYIYLDKKNERFRVVINNNGKCYRLGRFISLSEAILVRDNFLHSLIVPKDNYDYEENHLIDDDSWDGKIT